MNAASSTPTGSSDDWTVARVLNWSVAFLAEHGSDSPRLDAELLLAHSCGCRRIELYTNYERPLTMPERSRMRDLVQRRAAAEPVAYLIGYREFFGLDFEVNAAVLVPRPDTETLIRETLDVLKASDSARVLEIGTGSGCIAVSLAVNYAGAMFDAVDISPDALAVARRNAEKHRVSDRIRFVESDLYENVQGAFDVIVSNPPYVTSAEYETLDADVKDHEPAAALVGGVDGLDIVRRIVDGCASHLETNGRLILEIDDRQAEAVAALLTEQGFATVRIERDLSGHQRVVHGTL